MFLGDRKRFENATCCGENDSDDLGKLCVFSGSALYASDCVTVYPSIYDPSSYPVDLMDSLSVGVSKTGY